MACHHFPGIETGIAVDGETRPLVLINLSFGIGDTVESSFMIF
jgi:hypothetical protein